MRTRPLGSAGPEVTAIGCGEVDLERAAGRGIDVQTVDRAVHAAIEGGLTVVEAAREPDAERLVGNAVRALHARDRVLLVTHVHAGTAAAMQREVEDALRATRLEGLPLVLMPYARGAIDGRDWGALRDAQREMIQHGKVLRWGLSITQAPRERHEIAAAAADGLVAIEVVYSACARGLADVIAQAAAAKLGVLVREPLAGGALAGGLGPGVALAPGDDRHAIDEAMLIVIAEGIAALSAFARHTPEAAQACVASRTVLERAMTRRPETVECATVAELALRFAIDLPGVSCVLPRLHRPAHVAAAIAAGGAPPLPEAMRARVDAEMIELMATH